MIKYLLNFIIVLIFSSELIFAQTAMSAKDFFEKGVNLSKTQKCSEALEAFRQSAKLDAQRPEIQANIGLTLIALNRPAEAVTAFREAVRLAPQDGTFHTGLCRSLSLTNNHVEAIKECEEGVRLKTDSPDAHRALITALQIANHSDDEIWLKTQTALQKFPDDEILQNVVVAHYDQTADPASAAAIYEKLARTNPNSALYQIKLAEMYLRLERDSEAIAATQKATALESDNVMAYFISGKVYFELGQNEEAANAFQKVVDSKVNLPDAFYFLGLSESRRGKSKNAAAALQKAVALAPESFDYNKELGSVLIDSAKYEDAIAPLKKAVALRPKDFEANVALGTALTEAAQFDEATSYLMIADRLKPGNQIILMLLEVSRGRPQAAAQVEEMKAFAKEHPEDLNVRLHLIQLLTYGRKITEAEPYFAEVWKMNPPDVRVYEMIGTLRWTTGDYEKAVEAYRRAIEINQSPSGYLGLAHYYEKKGDVENTVKTYDKIFEIKPDSPNIMKLYADFLRDNGKRREALAMYQRSLTMLPTNSPALFNAGVLSAKFGDLSSAKQYLERLKTVDTKQAKILERFLRLKN